MQHAGEQNCKHDIDRHQAIAHGAAEFLEQLGLQLRIAAVADRDPSRKIVHDRQGIDGRYSLAERSATDEIRFHAGLALAVVSSDAGRPFAESDVGKRDERHESAALRRDAYLFEHLQVGTRILLEQDPDRHGPISGIELGKRRADITDGCNTDRLGQGLGRNSQAHG